MPINRKKTVLITLAWLTTVATIAGFALLINFVIQPAMQKETHGRFEYRYDRFVFWYPEESPQIAQRDALNARMVQIHDDLVAQLGISEDQLPERVQVFVHDNTSQMMASIQRRKGIDTMHSKASLDLAPGMDVRTQIAEHVLAQGWGTCYSQLAYRGLVTYLSDPTRDFAAPVAALPDSMKITGETLLAWEQGGRFPRTYYQKILAPSAKRYILTLLDLANLISIPDTLAGMSDHDLPTLLAASLMGHILSLEGGTAGLAAHWQGSTTRRLLEAAANQPLDKIVAAWHQEANVLASDSDDLDVWSVRFDIQCGNYSRANRTALQWADEDLTHDRRELLLLSTLLLGNVASAQEMIDAAPDALASPDMVAWTTELAAMHRVETDQIRVAGDLPENELGLLADRLSMGFERVSQELGMESDRLSLPLEVFVYRTRATRDTALSLLHSDVVSSASLHLCMDDDPVEALALSMCSYYWGDSRSELLRAGVAQAFSVEEDSLKQSACALVRESAWVPLLELMFHPTSDPLVRLEMGIFVLSLLETYGPELVSSVWTSTTMGGGSYSLIGALERQSSLQWKMFEEMVASRLCAPG